MPESLSFTAFDFSFWIIGYYVCSTGWGYSPSGNSDKLKLDFPIGFESN